MHGNTICPLEVGVLSQRLITFDVWTDLVVIFDKALHLLMNQQLMRMREKIMDYNFTVK